VTSRRVSPCTRYIRFIYPLRSGGGDGRRVRRVYIIMKGSVGLGGERDAGWFGGGEGVRRRGAAPPRT